MSLDNDKDFIEYKRTKAREYYHRKKQEAEHKKQKEIDDKLCKEAEEKALQDAIREAEEKEKRERELGAFEPMAIDEPVIEKVIKPKRVQRKKQL
jgi:hypothetical protein